MIKPQLLVCLFLALALGTTPLLAQPEASEKKAPASASPSPAQQTAGKAAPAQQAPASKEEPAQKRPAADSGDSPFDYRSSEEISEDLPVSFPVDI